MGTTAEVTPLAKIGSEGGGAGARARAARACRGGGGLGDERHGADEEEYHEQEALRRGQHKK